MREREQRKLRWPEAVGAGRPHREGPETWLLVPTSPLLCDLEQVTFLLWAYVSTDKVRLWAKSLLLGGGIMRDFFPSFL